MPVINIVSIMGNIVSFHLEGYYKSMSIIIILLVIGYNVSN